MAKTKKIDRLTEEQAFDKALETGDRSTYVKFQQASISTSDTLIEVLNTPKPNSKHVFDLEEDDAGFQLRNDDQENGVLYYDFDQTPDGSGYLDLNTAMKNPAIYENMRPFDR